MAQSPLELARAALLMLSAKGIPPTPDNYARYYHQIAGSPQSTSSSEEERSALARMLLSMATMLESTTETAQNLAHGIGEHQQTLQSSLYTLEQAEEKQPMLRLLAEILTTARGMHARVESSHQELQDTQEQLRQLQQEVETFRHETQVDPVTGAQNRQGLEYQLSKELARMRRQQSSLSIAQLVISNLDSVRNNPTQVSRLLVHLTEIARSVMRESDSWARFDERSFLLILPETDVNGAQFVVNRLRTRAERTPLVGEGGRMEIRLSGGITQAVGGEQSGPLLARVEQATQRALRGDSGSIFIADRSA